MKWRLMATSILLMTTLSSMSQEIIEQDEIKIGSVTLQLHKKRFVETNQGFCEAYSELIILNGNKEVYKNAICTVELDDIKFREKGYLTVIEHYSSPVGWSQFYVIDFCKKRLYITKKLQESLGLSWEKFIEPEQKFKDQYIEQEKFF